MMMMTMMITIIITLLVFHVMAILCYQLNEVGPKAYIGPLLATIWTMSDLGAQHQEGTETRVPGAKPLESDRD